MIKFNVEELQKAVKKLKGFMSDSCVISCTENTAGDGKYLAKLSASNGTAQATCICAYEADKPTRDAYMLGSSFASVLDTLAPFGDEVQLETVGETLMVAVGTATVPVPLLKDAMSIKIVSLKGREHFKVNVKKDVFASAVMHGSIAGGDDGTTDVVKIWPMNINDKKQLRFMSFCSFVVSEALCDTDVKDTTVFDAWAGDNKGVVVRIGALSSLVKRLRNDEVMVCITEGQLVIQDGNDLYCFVGIEKDFPSALAKALEVPETKYRFSVDAEKLSSALSVIALQKEKKIALKLNQSFLTVTTTNGNTKADLQVEGDGSLDGIILNEEYMRKIASTFAGEMSVTGTNGKAGIYFHNGDGKVLLLPISGN